MKKYIKYLILIVFILIVCILIYNQNNILETITNNKISMYGDPILEDGTINNSYFNISNNGKNALETTKGINNAIQYASNNNINYIKLEKGEYLINGVGERTQEKGIILKSNISLDLNQSKIVHEANSNIRYTVFAVYNVQNVKIYNGTIIGDRYSHDYNSIDSTHEWGYGVEVQGSQNINLYNLEIKHLTGDGIVLSGYNLEKKVDRPQNIIINNNNIFSNRRQGITITYCKNVKIYDNEIHSISGTSPGSAIDIEPDDASQIAEDIEIYNNNLYNIFNKLNIVRVLRYAKNINVHDNNINGNITVYGVKDKVKITNNIISNGNMYFKVSGRPVNNPGFLNKIEMTDNIIKACDFTIENVNNILIANNTIERSRYSITSSNVAIANNVISSIRNNQWVTKCNLAEGDNKNYNIYIYNNSFPSNTSDNIKQVAVEDDLIKVFYDESSYNKYIQEQFST